MPQGGLIINGKHAAYITLHNGTGIVVEGEKGYHPVSEGGREDLNKRWVNERNAALGVSQEMAEDLHNGSMFGWDIPAAGQFRGPVKWPAELCPV